MQLVEGACVAGRPPLPPPAPLPPSPLSPYRRTKGDRGAAHGSLLNVFTSSGGGRRMGRFTADPLRLLGQAGPRVDVSDAVRMDAPPHAH